MFRVILLAVALCLNSANSSPDPVNCVAHNEIVDYALEQIKQTVNAPRQSQPLDQQVNLIGFLNFGVHLSAPQGKWAVSQWWRFGNTTRCVDSIRQSDEGYFTSDDVVFDFDDITAKFLSIEVKGKMTSKFKPVFKYYVVNGTEECALVSFKLDSVDSSDFQISTDGFFGWFIGKILQYALVSNGVEFAQATFTQNCHQVFTDFANHWCEKMK